MDGNWVGCKIAVGSEFMEKSRVTFRVDPNGPLRGFSWGTWSIRAVLGVYVPGGGAIDLGPLS